MSRWCSVLSQGLVVSCQALEDEPLHSDFIMSKLALAASNGGAIGIRANSKKDIIAIKKEVSLPVIGIIKRKYAHSEIHISPTLKEVQEIYESGAEIIAFDATTRVRPDGLVISEFVHEIKDRYPTLLLMADISTYEEGCAAAAMGVDAVATTLCGYTKDTMCEHLPAFMLLEKLAIMLSIPVIAEGGIENIQQINRAFECGAYACVMGTAITRPQEITKKLVDNMSIKNR